jgi:hypothetical protein
MLLQSKVEWKSVKYNEDSSFGCWKSVDLGEIDRFSWRRCPSGVYDSETTKCVMVEWQAHRVGWMSWSKLLGLSSTDDADILKFPGAQSRRSILLQDSLEQARHATDWPVLLLSAPRMDSEVGSTSCWRKQRIHSLIVSIWSTLHFCKPCTSRAIERWFTPSLAQSAEAHNQVRFTTSGVFGWLPNSEYKYEVLERRLWS